MEEIIIKPTVRKPLIKKRTIQSQRKQIIKSRKQTATTIQREAKTYDKRMYDAFDTEPAAAIPMKEFPVFMQKELTRIEKLRQEQLLKAFPTPKIAEPLIKPVAITKPAKKEKMKEMFRIDELAIQKEELRLGTSVALASMMKTEQKQFQEHMKIFGIAEIQKPISIFKPEYIQKMAQAQEQIFKTPIPTKIKPFIFAPIKIKRKEIVPKEKKIISPISKEIRTIFKPPRIKEVKPIPIDRILPRALTFPDAGPPRDMFKLFRP